MDREQLMVWAAIALFEGVPCAILGWLVWRIMRRGQACPETKTTANAAPVGDPFDNVPPLDPFAPPEDQAARNEAIQRASEAAKAAAGNGWPEKPGSGLRVAVWGLGVATAFLCACWLDSIVGPLPAGVSYHAWIVGILLALVAAILLLFAVCIAAVITWFTRGVPIVLAFLTWGAFALGWAPLGWVLVIADGVFAGWLVIGFAAAALEGAA